MTKTILAISGSLRARSSNTAILLASADLAPAGFEVKLFKGLEDLPHFNPDREQEFFSAPALVHWRKEISSAHALLICSPEYAHGIPGTLKNALDWIVGTAELDKKPVAVINASPLPDVRPAYALENLVEVLKTMSADVRPEFILKIGEIRSKLKTDGGLNVINDESTRNSIIKLLAELGR